MTLRGIVHTSGIVAAALVACATQAQAPFTLEEASIADIHTAIRTGSTTCTEVVQGYIARARAYNGVCTALVTEDGRPVGAAKGAVRAGSPLAFPTKTVALSSLVTDFDQYKGKQPDWGRMEPTASDPSVAQQYGMVVGLPNAGQINALTTLNLRGERSITCKGDFDKHPSKGPLPAGAPAECEEFRKQPDALERAAQLDATYGRSFDAAAMPLYCAAMSFKAVFDTKDMHSTGGGDVKYTTDFAPEDATLVARIRDAGAIIYAKAHNAEYNAGSGDPGGDAKVERPSVVQGGARETWGGTTCNPYDTSRDTGGSSGGSGASVAANLVVCSICESTGGSCRVPGNYNGVVTLTPTKGMISYGGAIGANPYRDRPGIHCRTLTDAATVFDALRDKETGGYFDPRDIFTALPRSFASKTPYVAGLSDPSATRPLAGVRIGIVRELMVKTNAADAAMIDGIERELKVLQSLGATLVESTGPGYPDDPALPNMELTFEQAIAQVVPFHMPEILSWQRDGKPEFAVPGFDVTSREYLVAAASLKAPWPKGLDFTRMIRNAPTNDETISGYGMSFMFDQYLLLRGDDTITNLTALNDNAKYMNDVRRAAMSNWENKAIDSRTQALVHDMKRQAVMRLVALKVLEQNDIDVFVNPPLAELPGRIGVPSGGTTGPFSAGHGYGAALGIPEVFVPAGFADAVYEPTFKLNADATEYEGAPGTTPTRLASPLPFNMAFWAGPGEEATILKVASAYEAATHHRRPPTGFGPVAGERQSAAR